MHPDIHFERLSDNEKLERRNEKKKEYNRDRFRQKRSLYVSELQTLTEQLAKFTTELDMLKRMSILPWQDVAEALDDDRKLCEFQNRDLKKKVKANRALYSVMHDWIKKCESIRTFPSSKQHNWQVSSLPLQESSRKLGLEWISKRLYFNLEQEIERSGVPVTSQPYISITVEPYENSYQLTEYKQRVEQSPMEHVAKCLDKIYLTVMDGDVVEFDDPNMKYLIYESHFGQTLGISTREKMLVTQFKEQNQYAIFTHGVVSDEKYMDKVRCNYWTAWVVIKRLTPTETLIKHGYECHGLRYHDRFLNLEEEIPQLQAYDDEEEKFQALTQHLKRYRIERYHQDLADYAEFSKEIS